MGSVSIQVNHKSSTPIRTQIANAYAESIKEGRLKPGTRLPSIRALATRLKVSPATIVAAYRELSDGGFAIASPRSAFCVAGNQNAAPGIRARLPLGRIEPDLRIHPVEEFMKTLGTLAAEDLSIGGYEDYRGFAALRELLADMDRRDGILSEPGNGMIITSGAQQAIALAARSFGAGSRIAVEDPCYPGARVAFRNAGCELVPVRTTNDGPDPEALKRIASSGSVAAFYCCPTYGNPQGWTWSAEARLRVLEAAKAGGFAILEDDYLGDLDYLGEKPKRLAAHAADFPGVRVIRIRTFSKCLLPALRLAEVAGNSEFIAKMLAQKVSDDIGSSAIMQRGLARFIAEGRYDAHLVRVRPRYRAAREALRSAFSDRSIIGRDLRFDDPPAGLCLLGYLSEGIELKRFAAECEKDGVSIGLGNEYWLDGWAGRGEGRAAGGDSFRIGFGSLSPEEVLRAAAVFRKAAARAKENAVDYDLI
jgi:GntR family transcriptional regulator/MocR family aminotransferase